jgi:hypothetical protein
MPLPDTPAFRQTISSVTLLPPDESTGWESGVLAPVLPGGDPLTVWCKPHAGLTIHTLLERITKDLRYHGELASKDMALALLGMFAATVTESSRGLRTFHRFLDQRPVLLVRQLLCVASGAAPGGKGFRFGRFTVGPADRALFSSLLGGTPIEAEVELRWQALSRTFFCRRDPFAVRLPAPPEPVRPITRNTNPAASERFFAECLHEAEQLAWNEFLHYFADDQLLQAAFGARFIDLENIGRFLPFHRYSRFSFPAGTSVVLSRSETPRMEDPDMPNAVEDIVEELRQEYGTIEFGQTELDRTVRLFANTVAHGRHRIRQGMISDGFLQLIIALDLAFGQRSRLTESVLCRTAAATYSLLGWEIDDVRNRMERLYTARSRYVHRATPVAKESLQDAVTICETVLRILLRIRRYPARQQDTVLESWARALDVVWASHEAGWPVEKRLLDYVTGNAAAGTTQPST